MRRLIMGAALLAVRLPASAPAIHYAPAENLEHVDVALMTPQSTKSSWLRFAPHDTLYS
jgi:hypothetical protein